MEDKYICPVCGYDNLREDPYDQNYNICPSCFTEFGNDDCMLLDKNGKVFRLHDAWKALQQRWINSGMQWCSKYTEEPEDWNPEEQLKNIL